MAWAHSNSKDRQNDPIGKPAWQPTSLHPDLDDLRERACGITGHKRALRSARSRSADSNAPAARNRSWDRAIAACTASGSVAQSSRRAASVSNALRLVERHGLLSRLHGLTVDYLSAVEVVHVDSNGHARCDRFSAEVKDSAESLMLWGNQGGGGGNFGIVTKFFFADPPAAPSRAFLASESWNWEDFTIDSFTEFLQNYGQFCVDHKDPGDPLQGLFALLHLTCAPTPNIGLTVQLVGNDPDPIHAFRDAVRPTGIRPEPLFAPVGYHGIPVSTLDIQVMPWLFATQTLNGSGNPRRGKYKSSYMIGNFTASECEAIWKNLRESKFKNAQALLQVDSYGGQVNAIDPAQTAIPQRSSAMKLQYQTYWTNESDDEANLRWIRDFYSDMYGDDGPVPDGRLDGCYVNYPDVDLSNWKTLYYKENYPKLQQVKRRWDPLNIFNHAQSIE